MVNIYVIPTWFFSYDIILNLIFGLITFAVGYAAWKIYELIDDPTSRTFSIGFMFITFSYWLHALFSGILFTKLKFQGVIPLSSYDFFSSGANFFHIILFLLGAITLVYMTLQKRSKRLYALLCALTFIPVVFAQYNLYLFHVYAAILLGYVFYHYIQQYREQNHKPKTLVLIAFGILFLNNVNFILATNSGTYYIVSDIVNLVAYILILISLIRVRRK